jgi:5'-nucleotidase
LKILISNDDGIDSYGIIALSREVSKFGEVFIVAPIFEQSAAGHSITMKRALKVLEHYKDGKFFGYAINGTPADCVKIGITKVLNFIPDVVLSGINHGSNTATNLIYSGTVSAAREAAMMNIPGISFSINGRTSENINWVASAAAKIAVKAFEHGFEKGKLLNVNFPNIPKNNLKGTLITKQGISKFADNYDTVHDIIGREYHQLRGDFVNLDGDDLQIDQCAIENDFISISPIQLDSTDHKEFEKIKNWNFEEVTN